MIILEIFLIFTIPFLIIKFRRSKLVCTVGTAGIAYLTGICFSILATLLISTGVLEIRDISAAEIIAYLGIAIAIPLLLFSSNIQYLFKLSKKILSSFFLLIIAVFLICLTIFLLFSKNIICGEIFSGMAAALYTGGTPNLNAVAYFFQMDEQLILTANLSDIIFGGLFYVFLIFLAKPLLSKFLIAGSEEKEISTDTLYDESLTLSCNLKEQGVIRNFLLSLMIVLISAGIGYLIFLLNGSIDGRLTDYLVPALMIGTTVGGITLSFNKKIASVKENNLLGQYFACVFSYAIASMLDFTKLSLISLQIFAIFAIITTGTFILHAFLCKIFKIDANTMIITSTAGIYGPAFIPSVSKAIGAEYLLGAGLITGSFGYAIGTFFGIFTTYICKIFL